MHEKVIKGDGAIKLTYEVVEGGSSYLMFDHELPLPAPDLNCVVVSHEMRRLMEPSLLNMTFQPLSHPINNQVD